MTYLRACLQVPCHTVQLVEHESEGPLLVVGGEDRPTGRKVGRPEQLIRHGVL